MLSMKLVVAVSLIVVVQSLPFVEEEWHAEDDMLRMVHDDFPVSERMTTVLMQSTDPASIALAKGKAEDAAKAAAEAAKTEKKYEKEESAYDKKVVALHKAERAAQREATIDQANDRKKLKEFELKSTKEIAETNKATAALEKENTKLQYEYSEEQKQIAKEGAAAKIKYAHRNEETQKSLANAQKDLKKEGEKQEKIEDDMKKDAKKLKQDQADIELNFKKTTAHIKAEGEKAHDKMLADKAKFHKEMVAEEKTNADKAAADLAAIAAEKAKNEADVAKFKASFKKREEKEKAAKAKAKALYKTKTMAAKAALLSAREGTQKKTDKQALDDEAEYRKEMAEANILKKKAEDAKAKYDGAVKAAAKEQAVMDKKEAAQNAKDAAEVECATDGSECQVANDGDFASKAGACIKVQEKGPYLDDDLVSCSAKKPSEQFGGMEQFGIAPPLPRASLPKPTPACKAAREKFKQDPEFGFALEDTPKALAEFAGVSLACKPVPDSDLKKKKKALLAYFEVATKCPPWCIPGTETSDEGVQDTNGICIDGASVEMFHAQIEDLPEWKAMGTNLKIPGNAGIMSICEMAKNFRDGFKAGGQMGN
jgi:hypothetical protein